MLNHLRVTELSTGIGAAYAGKLLADAGAAVTVVEPPAGHPLRSWASSEGGRPGLLWDFLVQGKKVVRRDDPLGADEVAAAGVVIEDAPAGAAARLEAGAAGAGQVVVSLSPFGRTGPWRDRPANEFTIHALCGSTGRRGEAGRPPIYATGELCQYAAGAYAAAAGAAFAHRPLRPGSGVHVDLSVLEVASLVLQAYWSIDLQLRGSQPRNKRGTQIPSIEPTADGYVGFSTITAEQFQSFMLMIERPDLADDLSLLDQAVRETRREELVAAIAAWTTTRGTDEIVELATAMRIPVAPIGNGANLPGLDQFAERGVFVEGPTGLLQPRVPFRITPLPGAAESGSGAAGRLTAGAEHSVETNPQPGAGLSPLDDPAARQLSTDRPAAAEGNPPLPLAGVRIADFTAFWAGPAATHLFAALGADVIKVESIRRPDGMRFTSAKPDRDDFYEWGSVFHAVNTNKRAVTLDLTRPEGNELAAELVAWADIVIENFSPRVLPSFGFGPERIAELNPRAVFMRMPAFGLTGPWRDRTGFAMTVEQVSGMAWRTGYADGSPMDVGGICDPVGGMHAVVAVLAALAGRDRTGRGALVELPLVEAALNMTAEQVLAYGDDGTLITRGGNDSPYAAPQGCYDCGDDDWLALSVSDDAAWAALVEFLGRPAWATGDGLATLEGRRAARLILDARLAEWAADTKQGETAEALAERLTAVGVPAAKVVLPAHILHNPQLQARGFFEHLDHGITGPIEVPSLPFRAPGVAEHWYRTPAPTLGQHNDEVLGGLLGVDVARRAELASTGIIGDHLVRRS